MADSTWSELAAFVADVACYPFTYGRRIDWGEALRDAGMIPAFPGFSEVIFTAPLDGKNPEWFGGAESDTKLLQCIPVSSFEKHLLVAHGEPALLKHFADEQVDPFSPHRRHRPLGNV